MNRAERSYGIGDIGQTDEESRAVQEDALRRLKLDEPAGNKEAKHGGDLPEIVVLEGSTTEVEKEIRRLVSGGGYVIVKVKPIEI